MAKVKIYLEKKETMFEAESFLFKALNIQNTGELHEEDSFEDPAMHDLLMKVQAQHDEMFKEMVEEINAELDKDFSDGN